MSVLFIIIAILIIFGFLKLVYWLLEEYGFGVTFFVKFLLSVIGALYESGFKGIIALLISTLIGTLIGTGIDYFAYNKTSSFVGWVFMDFLLSIVLGFVIYFIYYFVISKFGIL